MKTGPTQDKRKDQTYADVNSLDANSYAFASAYKPPYTSLVRKVKTNIGLLRKINPFPFLILNPVSAYAHAYTFVASENQALS